MPATTRAHRGNPIRAANPMTATVTMAQLAPETAVRWVSDATRIAAVSP